MKRVRRQLAEWTPLTIALFVASIVSPRAGLYFHHHAGGDHAHVHAADDDDHDHDVVRHDDHLASHHHHHDHLIAEAEEEPEIEAPDHDETGHWHSQNRFHRAVAPVPGAADRIQLVQFVHALPEHRAVDRPALPAHARGPPLAA